MESTLKYCDHLYPSLLLENFYDLWCTQSLCDIILVVENEEIHAHKAMLSSSSIYFRRMFCGNLQESVQEKVFLHDLELATFKKILEFIYTSKIQIHQDNVQSLIIMSDFLQISTIQYPCCQYLHSIMNTSNCLSIYSIAVSHNFPDLASKAIKCAARDFGTIVHLPEFLDIEVETFLAILMSKYLVGVEESQIIKSIIHWVKQDLCNKMIHAYTLLSLVRLDKIPVEELLTLKTDPIICSANFKSAIEETVNSLLTIRYDIQKKNLQKFSNFQQSTRNCNAHEVILIIGGETGRNSSLSSVECFITGMSHWSYHFPGHTICISSMNYARSNFSATSTDFEVYVVGGRNKENLLDSVECFDVQNNKWTELAKLPMALEGMATIMMNQKLFVIGGMAHSGSQSISYEYSDKEKKWKQICPMKKDRAFHGCASVSGRLFSLGGMSGHLDEEKETLSCVEMLDISANRWHTMAPMLQPRANFGCVSNEEYIYVLGGNNDDMWLRCVERFSSFTNTWCVLKPMQVPRSHFGITIYDNRVYCVGGNDSIHNLNSVIKYNTSTDMWHNVVSMNTKRVSAAAVTVIVPKIQDE